ncbi:ABC transporter permease [Spirochaetia bacterium]|nr:ABC transporter permease [Spirochaetia bacterium]
MVEIQRETKLKIRKAFMGTREKNGIVLNIVLYTLLCAIGFIFLYPIIYMFVTSMMNTDDLLNSSTNWIPSTFYTKNYRDAILTMDYWISLYKNLLIAVLPTIFQVLATSLAGYSFARYEFPLKKLWMLLLIFTFVVPPQITMIPTYQLYTNMKLIGSLWAFILPAALGQGFKSAIFILIFYNFHRQVPKSLIEASEIDGAGPIYSFFKIAVPLSIPAIVVVILFSFVWYWNETFLVDLYLGFRNSRNNGGLTTLLIELQRFSNTYEAMNSGWTNVTDRLNEALRMAGTMLAILPLLVIYLILQRQFVESVDKAGITGE